MNIPFIVINWWAIKAYEKPINDNIIKNSLLLRYFKLWFIFLIITIMRIIDDKWINLYRKSSLENSNGKRKYSYLVLPIDNGNEIYWS